MTTAVLEKPMTKFSGEWWEEFVWIREGGLTLQECAKALDTTPKQIHRMILHAPRNARRAYSKQMGDLDAAIDALVVSGRPFYADEVIAPYTVDDEAIAQAVVTAARNNRIVKTGNQRPGLSSKGMRHEWVSA